MEYYKRLNTLSWTIRLHLTIAISSQGLRYDLFRHVHVRDFWGPKVVDG